MLYAFFGLAHQNPSALPGLFHDLIYYDLLWGYLHCQMNDGKFLAADALAIIQCNFDLIQPQLFYKSIGFVYTDPVIVNNSNVSLCVLMKQYCRIGADTAADAQHPVMFINICQICFPPNQHSIIGGGKKINQSAFYCKLFNLLSKTCDTQMIIPLSQNRICRKMPIWFKTPPRNKARKTVPAAMESATFRLNSFARIPKTDKQGT